MQQKAGKNAANALTVVANLPPNTAKRRQTPQHSKTPQNAAKQRKMLQNAAKYRELALGLRDQIFGESKKPRPLFRSVEINHGPLLASHGPLSPLKTFFLLF